MHFDLLNLLIDLVLGAARSKYILLHEQSCVCIHTHVHVVRAFTKPPIPVKLLYFLGSGTCVEYWYHCFVLSPGCHVAEARVECGCAFDFAELAH